MQSPQNDGKTKRVLRALLVEDSEEDALLLLYELERNGYEVHVRRVETAAALGAALDEGVWDIVLSDHHLPNFSSTGALQIVKNRGIDIPFIIVSGSIGEEVAIAAMRAGASDYILKNNMLRLAPAVEREIRDAADRRDRRKAERALLAQEEEFRIAREIQQRLFPARAPVLPGWDIAGASQPAQATGGDYFDYIPMVNGDLTVVVGDVSGHGIGPALLMAETRECLRALALTSPGIRDMLGKAARLLCDDFGADKFMTLFLGQLDVRAATFAHLSAGHPFAYVLDRDGRVRRELPPTSPALGLLHDPPAPEPEATAIAEGELVLLLTDGVVEATSPDGFEFEAARAIEVVRGCMHEPAAVVVHRLFEAVRAFTHEAPQQDDITAVVIKHTGRTAP